MTGFLHDVVPHIPARVYNMHMAYNQGSYSLDNYFWVHNDTEVECLLEGGGALELQQFDIDVLHR